MVPGLSSALAAITSGTLIAKSETFEISTKCAVESAVVIALAVILLLLVLALAFRLARFELFERVCLLHVLVKFFLVDYPRAIRAVLDLPVPGFELKVDYELHREYQIASRAYLSVYGYDSFTALFPYDVLELLE